MKLQRKNWIIIGTVLVLILLLVFNWSSFEKGFRKGYEAGKEGLEINIY